MIDQANLKEMTAYEASSEDVLRFRELKLDHDLLNDPKVIAQRVERQLIKRLQISAPWLLPMIVKL